MFGVVTALFLGNTPAAFAQAEPPANTVNGVRQPVRDPDDIPPASVPDEPPQACPKCTQRIVLDGSLVGGATRVVRDSGWSGLAGVDFTGLYERQCLELGAEGSLDFTPFGPEYLTLAALAGGKVELEPWLRLELLGDVGAETVDNVGAALFRDATGGSATQPYVGGRASVSFLLGDSRRFLLGWWMNGGDAIGESVVHPWVRSCFLGCDQSQETFRIGGPSWSTGIRIGAVASRW